MVGNYWSRERGFGLVEVLISAMVLAVGLLGLIALQNKALQTTQEGDNLMTAALIAQEMAKRMLSNNYRTSLGRQGYLATDLNNAVENAGGVEDWVEEMLSNNPDIVRCYAADDTQSCVNPGGNLNNSGDHQQALLNMQMMDEVEMRLLAWNSLPNGEIKICFDNGFLDSDWQCNDQVSRSEEWHENLFTIKVRWTNLIEKDESIYYLQFIAQCTDPDPAFCGQ